MTKQTLNPLLLILGLLLLGLLIFCCFDFLPLMLLWCYQCLICVGTVGNSVPILILRWVPKPYLNTMGKLCENGVSIPRFLFLVYIWEHFDTNWKQRSQYTHAVIESLCRFYYVLKVPPNLPPSGPQFASADKFFGGVAKKMVVAFWTIATLS